MYCVSRNFLGSLILAQVYLAAMSREGTLEKRRRLFYIYVDEAYRTFYSR